MEKEIYTTNSEEETISLGEKFAKRLHEGDIVALTGELGSGKTEFVKGICNYFNVSEIVTSPTFTIMNQYRGSLGDEEISIFHIDLYRIKNLGELDEIGFDDCVLDVDNIKLIEWAEKADGRIPETSYFINIFLMPDKEDERKFEIIAFHN